MEQSYKKNRGCCKDVGRILWVGRMVCSIFMRFTFVMFKSYHKHVTNLLLQVKLLIVSLEDDEMSSSDLQFVTT